MQGSVTMTNVDQFLAVWFLAPDGNDGRYTRADGLAEFHRAHPGGRHRFRVGYNDATMLDIASTSLATVHGVAAAAWPLISNRGEPWQMHAWCDEQNRFRYCGTVSYVECHGKPPTPVVVTLNGAGPYRGLLRFHPGAVPEMIQPTVNMFDTQFPYGADLSARGGGVVVSLSIEAA